MSGVLVPQALLFSEHNIVIIVHSSCFASLAELGWPPACVLRGFCLPDFQPLSVSARLCCSPALIRVKCCSVPLSLSLPGSHPRLQCHAHGVTLLWRSNYSKQSKELKTGHLNELREKYMRKQENVFIASQASNWKNRDQYSRTSFNGVKNNPPQDRQESLIAKQTGQLGLGRAFGTPALGPFLQPRLLRRGHKGWGHQGRLLRGLKAKYPPKRAAWLHFADFSPLVFSSLSLVLAETLGSSGWCQQWHLGWEMGAELLPDAQPKPLTVLNHSLLPCHSRLL